MSEHPPSVGVVGEQDGRSDVVSALDAGGIEVTGSGPAESAVGTDVDLLVVVGERAVTTVVARGSTAPLLPVDAGVGIRSVPMGAIDVLPDAIRDGDWGTERHVPLSVTVGDETVGTAAFDVALVTAEAARISEYDVIADGERLDRSRADGVVVATPAGSADYARRIDAPVLAPDTGVAVAWIAPFRTDPDRWVVRPDTLAIHVERDEATVDLQIDDRRVAPSIERGRTVSLTNGSSFTVAVIEVSGDRYD